MEIKKDRKFADTRFSFTLLRPNDSKRLLLDKLSLKYIVYSVECGAYSKLKHFQGYFETKEPMNLWYLKTLLKGYYIEYARESREANTKYCTKEGNFFIYDELTGSQNCLSNY